MATRGSSRSQNARPPLGDATERVINASPPKVQKGKKPVEPSYNPLRAHPVSSHPVKPHASNAAGPTTAPVNPRTSSISQDEGGSDKRASQISTSSNTSSAKRKTHIGPWQLGKTLGKGSAARVRLARHNGTQELAAVKILSKNACHLTQAGSLAELDKWDRNREEYTSENHMPLSIEREVAILKLIDHPNIMKLYDIWENRSEIYLVLEYVEQGDLFEYINRNGPIPEAETMYYFRQILSGLEYCHSFNICHRDLKPENILLKEGGKIKIADFGMAAIQQSPSHMLKTSCGSPHYAAPELVSRKRYRGDKVDVWSLGVILYAMLCARLPFDDREISALLAKATKGLYEMPEWLSYGAQSLIDKMLQVDPKDRVSTRKIWSQPLILEYNYLDDLNENGGQPQDIRTNVKCRQVTVEELDMQTLRQLKSMWHTFSEKYLAMKLTSPEPNDQKLFYWLLYNYRMKRLENYDANLTHSASDFHHLRPANWKKKYTTAEFPSRYGRTPSRFTVISNVATDAAGEALETETDGGATIESYDPYKGSRFMDVDAPASRARIVVHRNNSAAKDSMKASIVGRMQSGSTRSGSTKAGKHIAAPVALMSSRRSLASFKSSEGTPFKRPASRHKRGVDFSHVRKRSTGHRAVSIAGDDTTWDRQRVSASPKRKTWVSGKSARSRENTQTITHGRNDDYDVLPMWNEEMRQFTYSIAKDCDEAFNSSLLTSESYLEDGRSTDASTRQLSQDEKSLSIPFSTPTPTLSGGTNASQKERVWDTRPLPPAPAPIDSDLHEIMIARRRAEAELTKTEGAAAAANKRLTHPNKATTSGNKPQSHEEHDRRTVSAPIYSQYSTQWGKDAIPLPSINEGGKEDPSVYHDRNRIVSAPAESSNSQSTPIEDHKGLDYLAKHDETIRVVTSPSGQPIQNKTPASLNVRKKPARDTPVFPQARNGLNLRQKYQQGEIKQSFDEPSTPTSGNSSSITKKKSSWFRRSSKDKNDVFNAAAGSVSADTDHLTYTDTNSSTGPAFPPTKKKSFSLAFWRNSKDQQQKPQTQMSIGGNNFEDSPSPEPVRMSNHPARPPHNKKWADEAPARNIEPQQNWLARLFRVKPAMRYLCFTISRRRARQEVAILLKQWRKYGMRGVQVDKERNIVFARVGGKNYLNMKEVAFAAEIMTVIEHGKRNQMSIVRFTQEQGAASSFHKVVDTMNTEFESRNLLVADQRKAKMMIKTLNS